MLPDRDDRLSGRTWNGYCEGCGRERMVFRRLPCSSGEVAGQRQRAPESRTGSPSANPAIHPTQVLLLHSWKRRGSSGEVSSVTPGGERDTMASEVLP